MKPTFGQLFDHFDRFGDLVITRHQPTKIPFSGTAWRLSENT
jgi:hypothetical protein